MIRTSEVILYPALGVPSVGELAATYPEWAYLVAQPAGIVTAIHSVDVTVRRRAWDQEARQRGRHAMCRGVLQHAKRRAA